MIIQVDFPKRIKYAKTNPLEDFYSKCVKQLSLCTEISGVSDTSLARVQVWAFSVNKKNYAKLKLLVKKHVKKQYPYLAFKKIDLTVGMIMLDIGPRVDNKVPDNQVFVNQKELYENRNNEN